MTRPRNIIVADIDPDMRTIIRMHFDAFGFVVFQAAHGLEAVDLAERTDARLVLLHTDLPRLGAYEACARIRRLAGYRDTPIVMMTVGESPKVRAAARWAGATKVVVKPLSVIDLCRELEPLMTDPEDPPLPVPWRGLAEASPPLIWQPKTKLEWLGRKR
ncbi:MAG TPA: response regulator [Acetobacteraceae bacterium]|jgi:DNA-binding response OmpR family regulator